MIKTGSNEIKQLNGNLQDIAWLLEDEEKGPSQPKVPNYGDVTELNTERTILDSVGRETLELLAEDIMALLDTSVAVYEKNGDYAYGSFVSEWCSLMDGASRALCNTDDNKKALDCGRWLCHENCWNDSAKAAMKSGKITDIACVGCIRLYSVPIIASGNIIGSINMGYGNPPTDEETQKNLSRTFCCDRDSMRKAAEAFNPRPRFLIDIAKKRLQSIAVQIGRTVEAVQNEEKLKDVAQFPEENRNPVFRVDNEMRLLYANPAAMKLIVDPGTKVGDKIPAQWHSLVQEAWFTEAPVTADVTLHGKVYSFSSAAIKDREYVNVYATDITLRKQAEEALINTLYELNKSQAVSNVGNWVWHIPQNRVEWSDEMYHIFGISKERFTGDLTQVINNCIHPDDQAKVYRSNTSVMEEKTPIPVEYRIIRPDKSERIVWAQAGELKLDEAGNPILLRGIVQDITERKQAEIKDKENQKLLSTTFEAVDSMLTVIDKEYRILLCNWKDHEWVSLEVRNTKPYCYEAFKNLDSPCENCQLQLTFKDGQPRLYEDKNPIDGSYKEISISPIFDDNGDISYVMENVRDITERKIAEEVIAAEKDRLAVTLLSIGDGVITTDTLGNIVIMNKVAEELCGWKQNEAQGKPLFSVFNIINENTRKPHENPVEKVISTGDTIELANHTLLISRDGTERAIADSGAPIKDKEGKIVGVVLVFRDMTEKHQVLEQMQHMDKLEALGVLAGGIAHDFNNLLGGIFGYIEMARDRSTNDPIVSKYLDKTFTAFERAKDLTQQLLTFSKGGEPKRQTGNIGKLVKESANFVLSGTNVRCNFHIDEDLWLADYDENQMGQVIDNMVLNAQHAMPAGGTINISVINYLNNDGKKLALTEKNYVKISIADTGTGIPQELHKRIFDPFFTTKQKGSGLGLATCYSIVQKHDGYIDVESVLGKGSSFHIYLPATHTGMIHNSSKNVTYHQGKGHILVMDDEAFMREIVGDMLTTMGYNVIVAQNGEEVLQLCAQAKKQGDQIIAALFDLTIPGGMGGKETIVPFKELFPETPVFASSGFYGDPSIARPTDFGFTDSIRKPFKTDELAEMLNKHIKL